MYSKELAKIFSESFSYSFSDINFPYKLHIYKQLVSKDFLKYINFFLFWIECMVDIQMKVDDRDA